MDTLRRLLFALAVFLVASAAFSLWRGGQPGYGLLNFLRTKRKDILDWLTSADPKIKGADETKLKDVVACAGGACELT